MLKKMTSSPPKPNTITDFENKPLSVKLKEDNNV